MATENNTFKDKVLAINTITDDDELDMTLEGWTTDNLKRLRVPSNGASHDVMASAGFILEQRKTEASAMPQSSSQQPAGGPAPTNNIPAGDPFPDETTEALKEQRAALLRNQPAGWLEISECITECIEARSGAVKAATQTRNKVAYDVPGSKLPFTRGFDGWDASTNWVVKKLIPAGGFGCLIGPSGSYKSFCAVDVACSVATGEPFGGTYSIKRPGPVVYFAGEGVNGVKTRFYAWASKHPEHLDTIKGDIFISPQGIDMGDPEKQKAVISAIRTIGEMCGSDPSMVIIDTLGKSLAGDENNAEHVRKFIKGCQDVQLQTGVSMLVVHHTVKTVEVDADHVERGGRGAGSIYDDSDFELHVRKRKGFKIAVFHTKAKDVGFEPDFTLPMERIVLGHDADGDEISSLVVCGALEVVKEAEIDTVKETNKKAQVTFEQRAAFDELKRRGRATQQELVAYLVDSFETIKERTAEARIYGLRDHHEVTAEQKGRGWHYKYTPEGSEPEHYRETND
ncbi:TPA: AAA family ATPase [Enterobacter cloacae]|uniref:AAA family ATPase n=1 Tax=Enterobacter kobei TaxID=208224 RepID=A0A2J0PJA9_9ENTR|nr:MULTISPECIES: AAA family ATPase [Enterobacter cloacae complex]KPU03843.1 hypothetical protein AN697_16150 [Enterobacter cloacae subsp. cloacae]PJD65361.1 hypothetical protein B9Q29_20520 [Enterobacter kobei]PJD74635.1 hypothetical protein B9Q37_12130 [Enterobacter kobei]